MKIYTKTGDQGRTSLFGGRRVTKQHARLESYGTLDELNGYLGWFVAKTSHEDLSQLALGIQSRLFDLGAHLATPSLAVKARRALPTLDRELVQELERAIDRLEEELPPLSSFILPGGNEEGAILHLARAVCRRAERTVVRVKSYDSIHPEIIPYLNRLSDLLFVMARAVVHRAGDREVPWVPRRAGA